jgi:hypothetical protein
MGLPDKFNCKERENPPSAIRAIFKGLHKSQPFFAGHIGPDQDQEYDCEKEEKFDSIVEG